MNNFFTILLQFIADNYLQTLLTLTFAGLVTLGTEVKRYVWTKTSATQHATIERIFEEAVVAVEQFSARQDVQMYGAAKRRMAEDYVNKRLKDLKLNLKTSDIELMIENALAQNHYNVVEIQNAAKPKNGRLLTLQPEPDTRGTHIDTFIPTFQNVKDQFANDFEI